MSLFAGSSRLAMIVAGGYLIVFFALASGVVNAFIEGAGARSFIIHNRSVQTMGETAAITFILFVGLGGTFMIFKAGKTFSPKTQKFMLGGGFGILAFSLLIGYLLVGVKL